MLTPWEDIELGIESGSTEVELTHEIIDEYLESMDLDYSLFRRDRGDDRIAPPDLAPKLAARNLYTDYIREHFGNPIRAKQAFAFDRAVRVGTRLKATGRLVEKYERREKQFLCFEAQFTDGSGTTFLRDHRTFLLVPPSFLIKQ
ncbi:MAG: hypothetical protein O2910_00290 [Proteobacteria bacterium]|nr:hypothetical protein [Pseudomonadota bacterium]